MSETREDKIARNGIALVAITVGCAAIGVQFGFAAGFGLWWILFGVLVTLER